MLTYPRSMDCSRFLRFRRLASGELPRILNGMSLRSQLAFARILLFERSSSPVMPKLRMNEAGQGGIVSEGLSKIAATARRRARGGGP